MLYENIYIQKCLNIPVHTGTHDDPDPGKQQ